MGEGEEHESQEIATNPWTEFLTPWRRSMFGCTDISSKQWVCDSNGEVLLGPSGCISETGKVWGDNLSWTSIP